MLDLFELDQYNLFSPQAIANPYPIYARLRSEDPVHLDETLGCWVVTRYADVVAALSNRSLSSERISAERLRGKQWQELRPLFHLVSKQMLLSDPPAHTRMRALVSKAFTPRAINVMRAHIQQIVDGLISALLPMGRMDVIQDFAYPLPTIVISEMLGIPQEEREQFKCWTTDLANFLGNPLTLAQSQQAFRSVQALQNSFHTIIEQRRKCPQDDLITALVLAEEKGDVLSEDELFSNCMGLFTAGHETTTNLIGNGLLALLHHPDQLQRLRDEPGLITTAIEELLRFDSPIQYTARLVKKEVEIGGKHIREGEGIMLMLGAANRDPAQFPEPDRLIIGRRENRHLAFGHNIHFCIGAALARLEAHIAFETLLSRLPSISLETEALEWQGNLAFHGLKSLPVAFAGV